MLYDNLNLLKSKKDKNLWSKYSLSCSVDIRSFLWPKNSYFVTLGPSLSIWYSRSWNTHMEDICWVYLFIDFMWRRKNQFLVDIYLCSQYI